MLNLLKIKNIALIEECVIDFKKGFNTLTGETGAGKSIIIDSLNFVLGARSDKSLIKSGTDHAKVEAVFETSDQEVFDLLNSYGIEPETTIILCRSLNLSGKNECRINGEIVTLNMLKRVTEKLVDVFGQNDQQFLLDTKRHLLFLDVFNPNVLLDDKNKLTEQLDHLKNINNQISEIGGDGAERERNIDLLKYQINEIVASDLKQDEETSLTERKNILLNSEKIAEKYNELDGYVDGSYGVLSSLKGIKNIIEGLEKYISLEDLSKRFESATIEIDDILESVNEYRDKFEYNESELDEIESRLDQIKSLKRKYGNTIDEIMDFLKSSTETLNKLENATEELERLKQEKRNLLDKIYETCEKLTIARKRLAQEFEQNIINRLRLLGMKSATFKVDFKNEYTKETIEEYVNKNGADNIEFLFSANLGEPLKPLVKIISGGELSRFMLAFKTVSNIYSDRTYVFDEIDTGIGGEIGVVVGQQMCLVSTKCQVLCVTHLAQIACFADNNLKITKYEENGKTFTMVKHLNEKEKVVEVARMVGATSSEYATLYATELIETANKFKKSIWVNKIM